MVELLCRPPPGRALARGHPRALRRVSRVGRLPVARLLLLLLLLLLLGRLREAIGSLSPPRRPAARATALATVLPLPACL